MSTDRLFVEKLRAAKHTLESMPMPAPGEIMFWCSYCNEIHGKGQVKPCPEAVNMLDE